LGPDEFDLASVEEWYYPRQKEKPYGVSGNSIFRYLGKNKLLSRCLTLQEGNAIQKKGLEFSQQVFGDKVLTLWGSVAENEKGFLEVPCLFRGGIHWHPLTEMWGAMSPAGLLHK
jgi:hypothetical protein